MTYLSEDPWPLVGLLGLIAAGFLIALRVTQQGEYLIRALVAAGLALLFLAVEWAWVTDNERIEAVVYDLASAVEAGDLSRVTSHLTPDVRLVQNDRTLIEGGRIDALLSQLENARFDFVRVNQLEAESGAHTRRGRAEFRVVASGTFPTSTADLNFGSLDSRWDLGFRETTPGVWKVNRITPIRGVSLGALLRPSR
ncbi:hypothetical protein EP7_000002 [Isosphaeraceae bacterium EP7]